MVDKLSHHYNVALQLREGNLTITVVYSDDEDWLGYTVQNDDLIIEDLGRQHRTDLKDKLPKILTKEVGKPLELISQSPLNDVVKDLTGDSKTEYLGYMALSNHNTFYFFRHPNGDGYIVIANSLGECVLCQRLGKMTFYKWNQQIVSELQ